MSFLRTAALLALSFAGPIAAQQVYFGNLHSHTSYSDGSGKPAEAYQFARNNAKVDFLMISEHNHSQAEDGASTDRRDGILIAKDHSLYTGPARTSLIPAARKSSLNGKFLGLYGQEFSSISKGNHVNVFDVDTVIDVPNGDFAGLVSWMTQHHDSLGQPPILQFNHPELFDNKATEYGADDFASPSEWIQKIGAFARLIEIVAGPAMTKVPAEVPKDAEDEFLRYLNLGFRVAPTADQDNHYKTWGNASPARTGVIADELTKPAILGALRNRHVYATEDSNLRLVFKVQNRLMGDVIAPTLTAGQELDISVSIHDDDEPQAHYEIDVLSDSAPGGATARVIDTVSVDGNTTAPVRIEDVTFTGKGQYLFFRVRQIGEDRVDRAWTSPVWFDDAEVSPVVPPVDTVAIASRLSRTYHTSPDCVDAQRIKPTNRIEGDEARRGRLPHEGCPRRQQ